MRCFAVIFTNQLRRPTGPAGYEATSERMVELAASQPGFLGIDSVRGSDGVGITVSYWDSEAAITAWRDDVEHAAAREQGRAEFYEWYDLRVAEVTRRYGFSRPPGDG